MDFVREKVAEWELDSFVTKLAVKPPRINPMTVAIKVNPGVPVGRLEHPMAQNDERAQTAC